MSLTQVEVNEMLSERDRQIQELQTTLNTLKESLTQPNNDGQNAIANRVDSSRVPKIPQISRKNLENWFFQVEASFRRAGITQSSTKFDYLVMALDDEAMSCISHLIRTEPLPTDVFEQAKTAILKAFSLSDEENLRKLLKGQVNLNSKPTQLLREIRTINLRCNLTDNVLKSIFFEQLTSHQKEILILMYDKDLDTIGEAADKLVSLTSSNSEVYAVNKRDEPSVSTSSTSNLETKLDTLIDLMKSVVVANAAKNRPNRSRSRSRDNSGLCYAH